MIEIDYPQKLKSMLILSSDEEKIKGYMAFIKGYVRASMKDEDLSRLIGILEDTVQKICNKE